VLSVHIDHRVIAASTARIAAQMVNGCQQQQQHRREAIPFLSTATEYFRKNLGGREGERERLRPAQSRREEEQEEEEEEEQMTGRRTEEQ